MRNAVAHRTRANYAYRLNLSHSRSHETHESIKKRMKRSAKAAGTVMGRFNFAVTF
jgi:hypothetical protein